MELSTYKKLKRVFSISFDILRPSSRTKRTLTYIQPLYFPSQTLLPESNHPYVPFRLLLKTFPFPIFFLMPSCDAKPSFPSRSPFPFSNIFSRAVHIVSKASPILNRIGRPRERQKSTRAELFEGGNDYQSSRVQTRREK